MNVLKYFALFLIILVNFMVQKCQSKDYCRIDLACQEKLGMASDLIKDHHISASSYYGTHRPKFSRFHGKSAWCVSAAKGRGAYLEVDLGRVKRLTWLGVQGYGKGYVTNYTIQYKRRMENKYWRPLVERMPQNISRIVTIRGNSDNSSKVFTKLKGSRIVRFVRIVLLGGVGKQWCLKLEMYGCEWKNKDGLISYYSTQGNIRGENETSVIMNDATYDGAAKFLGHRNAVLEGGLGQLTDGELGGNAFWYDLGNGKSFEWVGWFDMKNAKPDIQFNFDSPRKFNQIRFHGNNRPGNVRLFRNLLVAFSTDGQYFSRKFVFYPSRVLRNRRNESMWIEVDLRGHVGRYLNCEFSYDGKWIVLSEIEFDSVPATGLLPVTPNTPLIETTESDPSQMPVGRRPNASRIFPLGVPVIIGIAVTGLVLVVLTIVLIVWLKKRQRDSDDGNHASGKVVRIVNSLKRGSLKKKERSKRCSSSSESDENVDDLVQKKLNNFVPSNQPWYKSLDRHKMKNINKAKSGKEYKIEENGKEMNDVDM